MEIAAVIPARFGSTRFPGKPLIDLAGVSMIVRVCRQVAKCKSISSFWVGTDDDRIFNHCTNENIPVLMTSDQHTSGTERAAEVAQRLTADVIINVQGDEPFLDPTHLEQLCALFSDPDVEIGTLMTDLHQVDERLNPNIVKVVTDRHCRALYFSRAAIPARRDGGYAPALRHLGIYAFRRDTLMELVNLTATPLEESEKLEQLRWLEHGYQIKLSKVQGTSPAIDTPEDMARALVWLKAQEDL